MVTIAFARCQKRLIYVAETMRENKGKQEFPKLALLIQKIVHVATAQLLLRMICVIHL